MIDAFRLINPNMMVLGQEPRQTTSVLGHLQKPSIQGTFLKTKYVFEQLTQILYFSSHSWPQQTLLLYCHQLPQKRIGTKNVDESEQKVLGGWFDVE